MYQVWNPEKKIKQAFKVAHKTKQIFLDQIPSKDVQNFFIKILQSIQNNKIKDPHNINDNIKRESKAIHKTEDNVAAAVDFLDNTEKLARRVFQFYFTKLEGFCRGFYGIQER